MRYRSLCVRSSGSRARISGTSLWCAGGLACRRARAHADRRIGARQPSRWSDRRRRRSGSPGCGTGRRSPTFLSATSSAATCSRRRRIADGVVADAMGSPPARRSGDAFRRVASRAGRRPRADLHGLLPADSGRRSRCSRSRVTPALVDRYWIDGDGRRIRGVRAAGVHPDAPAVGARAQAGARGSGDSPARGRRWSSTCRFA